MKLSDFIMLDTEEKKLAVLHLGVLIAKRKQHSSMAFLFQLDHFYVETWFNCTAFNRREQVTEITIVVRYSFSDERR